MRQSARRQAGTTCNPQSAFLTDADAWRLALFDSGAPRLLDPSRQPSTCMTLARRALSSVLAYDKTVSGESGSSAAAGGPTPDPASISNCAKVLAQSSHPSSDASPGNSLDSGGRGISVWRRPSAAPKSDRLPPFAGPVFPRRSVPLAAWALLVSFAFTKKFWPADDLNVIEHSLPGRSA